MSKNLLKERLEKNGFAIKEFWKKKNVPLSYETFRTVIIGGARVSIPSIMIVALYLGLLPSEIKEILHEKGDRDFSRLIGDDKTYLTKEEEVIISIHRKIKSKDKIIDHMALVAKAEGANITRELTKLRKK